MIKTIDDDIYVNSEGMHVCDNCGARGEHINLIPHHHLCCPEDREETLECEVPTEENLADLVLKWWQRAQYLTTLTGDDNYDRIFDEEPDFVRAAKQIKKEAI